MDAILILLIIAFQFTLIHFGVKHLSELNNRLILLNENIEKIIPTISPTFQSIRKQLCLANKLMIKYLENKDKIKTIKYILLVYSLISAIIIFKRKRNIFNSYSLYDVIMKATKTILGY